MVDILETTFRVHSYEVDAFGVLSPSVLAGFLQESAAVSADSLGFGISDLNTKGCTWVLVREHFELDEAIRLGDVISLQTWPSGVARRAALRDFRILKENREVGRALTSWLVLDIASRRPVRPHEVLPEALHVETPHVLPVSSASIPIVDSPAIERAFQVRFSDIDANLHVTNASYVEWMVEAIGEETWRSRWLSSLDIQFVSECSLGSEVKSRSVLQRAEALHSIIREYDSKELARARSTWKTR
jgi:medium-chain acyl-[acyl-carrier-protein] hydrolase